MEKNAKIYVAGHKGLVGSAILRALEKSGYNNCVVRSRQELDLTCQSSVERFFDEERPEYVFLAAAKVGGILANATYPADFIYQNLVIETNVIHAAYKYGAKKLLFLGSSCIYPRDCPQPMKEEYLLTGPLEPTNEPYAVAKIAGIKMCEAYDRQYGTKYISVMPTNLYGPNDNFDLETSHVLPALIRKFHLAKLAMQKDWEGIKKNEVIFGRIPDDFKRSLGLDPKKNLPLENSDKEPEVVLWGTGSPRREFLHVDDLADACIYLMDNYDGSEIVNIGVGKDITIRELAELIAKIVGYQGKIRFDTSKPDGTPRKLLDVSKLSSLGWQPTIGLEEGIKKTYGWFLSSLPLPIQNS